MTVYIQQLIRYMWYVYIIVANAIAALPKTWVRILPRAYDIFSLILSFIITHRTHHKLLLYHIIAAMVIVAKVIVDKIIVAMVIVAKVIVAMVIFAKVIVAMVIVAKVIVAMVIAAMVIVAKVIVAN